MRVLHLVVGWAIVAALGALWLWGLGAKFVRRRPGRWFWTLVAVVQVALVLQLVAGLVLLALGRGQSWLHYAYGIFPIAVLVIAHAVARELQRDPWVPFAWAAFFSWGLALRALMTGLGIG